MSVGIETIVWAEQLAAETVAKWSDEQVLTWLRPRLGTKAELVIGAACEKEAEKRGLTEGGAA